MRVAFIKTLSLALLFLCGYAHAQQRLIKGRVVDEKGVPLPGVDVVVQGTRQGTSTDLDGNYTIGLDGGQRLEFSYVGYQSKTVKPGLSNNLDVTLTLNQKNLSEVVVVGYGEKNKAELSSAISQVDVKKTLEQTSFSNVSEALSGSVSGISVSAGSGQPGSATFDIIRGVGSIGADSRPLYVINGVPIINDDPSSYYSDASPLAALDPNSIKSVSILKDASATAIYGARGANGVILITTKSGAYNQKTSISFRSEYSLGDVAMDKFKPLNSKDWIERYAMGLLNSGEATDLEDAREKAIEKSGWDGKTSTDWKDYTTRDKAMVLSNNLNISGGTQKTRYNLGVGLYTNKGLQLGTDFNRYSFNSSLTHRYSDKLTFGTNFNLAHAKQNGIVQGSYDTNPVAARYLIPPIYPAYNEDGTYNEDLGPGKYNPAELQKRDKSIIDQLFLNGSAFAEYRFLDAFKFRSNFSGNYMRYDQEMFGNPVYGNARPENGTGSDYYTGRFTWDWTNTLNFKKRFGMHAFDVDLGTSITEQRDRDIRAAASNYAFPDRPSLRNASVKELASSLRTLAHFRSYFTRLTYTLNGKYSMTGTYRRDGSSRFRPSERYGNFWALSGAWNLSQEDFISDFFDDLKLRASFGTVGNAEIGDFAYFTRVSSIDEELNVNDYNNNPGFAPANVGDADLSWETKQQLDIGLDMAAFDNHLRFVFDYYHARSYDLLLDVPLSMTSGFDHQLQNLGEMVNQGIEMSLSGDPIHRQDLTWNVKAVFSINSNEVTSLGDFDVMTGMTFKDRKLPTVGKPLGTWYMRGWAGVDPKNGRPLWYTDSTQTKTTSDYGEAGLYYQGNSIPRYIAGLTNTLRYKYLSLSFLLDYKGGYKVYNSWAPYYDAEDQTIVISGGRQSSFADHWTPDNPDAKYPKYNVAPGASSDIVSSAMPSSRFLYDGDFIRLRNIQLGYTLPKTLAKDLKLTNLTFYLKGTNLWTLAFDKDLYFDPESMNNQVANKDIKQSVQWKGAGYYNLTQPVMRYYGMGINITF